MKQQKKRPLLRCGTLLTVMGAVFWQFGVYGTKAETELNISAGQESQTELSTSCEQETDTDLSMAGVQMSRLQLKDLSMYAESLQEDLDEMQDLYTESVQWENAGTPLEESDAGCAVTDCI